MGYIAVKVGIEAIENACRLFALERSKGEPSPLGKDQIRDLPYLAVDRIMGERGYYAHGLAALAFKKAAVNLVDLYV